MKAVENIARRARYLAGKRHAKTIKIQDMDLQPAKPCRYPPHQKANRPSRRLHPGVQKKDAQVRPFAFARVFGTSDMRSREELSPLLQVHRRLSFLIDPATVRRWAMAHKPKTGERAAFLLQICAP